MNSVKTIGLLVTAALLTTAVPAASAPRAPRSACDPLSTIDSVCRERATLHIRRPWTPKMKATPITNVTNNATLPVVPLTGITVIRGGVTNLYFKKQATCQAVDSDGGGTRIQTRISSGVIFYQAYGLTLCTMVDGSVVAEGPGATIKAADPRTSKKTPTQFTALLDPSAGLQVAVHTGKLLVTLSNGHSIPVNANEKFDAALIGPKTLLIANPYPTKFTTDEDALFASQAKRIGR